MEKLRIEKNKKNENIYYLTNPKEFSSMGSFDSLTLENAFNFAYDMSFDNKGAHRDHRSGGTYRRKNGEIFTDTFQGKLGEFAIYDYFKENGILLNYPDLKTHQLGIWDTSDFEINGLKIAVKSTKKYGQLLLLEKADWDSKGQYIPNLSNGNGIYDVFILVRISPSISFLMKKNKLYYSNKVEKNVLKRTIFAQRFNYDIPGFIDREVLVKLIAGNFVIPKGAMLNSSRTVMDADNYYIQAGDMMDIKDLVSYLKSNI
ncbi:hypothetical protein [Anoxybacillus suryakundensis]|uniref:Uncharacterized protein n=1 Tax=Anoxybacillus suryakundensis TaxID=1325335 RepID=A0A0K6GL00_9BACL|nr:hypothetical protein [Anoxybacillus suryakundensis]CUA79424.1 hypothetical protein Ga0061060_10420 [Anoxybacillus suryakundensis]